MKTHPMLRNPLDRLIAIGIHALVLAVIVLAARRSILMGWADWEFRLGKPETLERAERLMPGNAQYHYARAQLLDQKDPTSQTSEKEFAAAVAENPRYSDALLAWSVDKELRGDKSGAEQLLLQARRNDRLLRPTWALANFYYRQDDATRFWPQARASLDIIARTGLSIARFDPTAVFELCWHMTSDSKTILVRAIPNALDDAYLGYLMTAGRTQAAVELADAMLPRVTKSDILFVAPYCSMLISQNRIDDAIRTWHMLYTRGVVTDPGPDLRAGSVLTNGNLAGAPQGFGFDWKAVYPDPVRFSYSPAEHSYRFDFDGNEPEQLGMLTQTVPLAPGTPYRFTARFRCGADAAQAGFLWTLADHRTGITIPAVTSSHDNTTTLEFTAPRDATAADLALRYSRQYGTVRFQGSYELRHAELRSR
jgi:hypothetical protein